MRSPQKFEIVWESRFGAWAKDIAILFSRVPPPSASARPFRSLPKNHSFKPVRAFLLSVAFHVSAFLLITHLDFGPSYRSHPNFESPDTAPIYIDAETLQALKILRDLPRVKPPGKGGQPGQAEKPVTVVLQASTAEHPKFTMVLNPLKPDNNRQAIHQDLSPPELKIQAEQKVPDIVLAGGPPIPKPRPDMSLHRPVAPENSTDSLVAPVPDLASNVPALQLKIAAAVPQPKLPVSYFAPNSMQAPHGPSAASAKVDPAPDVASNAPELQLQIAATVAQPKLPVSYYAPRATQASRELSASAGSADPAPDVASNGPELQLKIAGNTSQPQMPGSYFAPNSMHAPRAGSASSGKPGGATGDASGDSNGGVVVLSVDPGTFSKLASLAQGNRYGTLAIAPSKEGLGSPGGSPSGVPASGSGGPGRGGDGSTGVGPGHSGGGGGGTEGPQRATLSAVGGAGKVGGVDSENLLGPVRAAAVYPVPSPSKLRRAPLVVSTGPMGGGGLDVYGALPCGKVYTIFLPMPGKSWVLQYCAHESAAEKPQQAGANVVQMETGLVPPSADQQFDFHRLAVPEKDADKMIVLRGMIGKDGAINDVHVFRGVQPEMDAQAALAFSSWKFRPATRASLPISVDVLIGIPARVPERANESTGGAQGNQN